MKESETFNEIESYFSKISRPSSSSFFYPSRTVYFVYKFRILWFENFRNSPVKAISIKTAVCLRIKTLDRIAFYRDKDSSIDVYKHQSRPYLRQNRTLIDNDVYINIIIFLSLVLGQHAEYTRRAHFFFVE